MAWTADKMVRAAGTNTGKSDISFHDEDDMASDDALGVASQQSIKAYAGTLAAAYVLIDGTRALTANWDAGAFEIRALTFESDQATGSPPLTIASTTVVPNLNVDQVDGKDSTDFVLCDGTQALTANWDVGAFTLTATQFISDIAIGTAPLVVTSTTVVTNLNADTVDGSHAADLGHGTAGNFKDHGDVAAAVSDSDAQGDILYRDDTNWTRLAAGTNGHFLKTQGAAANPVWAAPAGGGDLLADGSVPLTANWDVGAYTITALRFISDQATGTAPFTVASVTVVTNLNADLLDGNEASVFLKADGSISLSAAWDVGSHAITATQFISDIAIGTAPLVVTSTTVVTNLNADTVDGSHAADLGHGTAGNFKDHGDVAAAVSDSDAQGDILYRDDTNWTRLAAGTNGHFLKTQGAAANPVWAAPAGGGDLLADGSVPLTANWDVGAFTITGTQFISDIAIGTAPLVVTSTTVVPNLNVDQVDGKDATDLVLVDGTQPPPQTVVIQVLPASDALATGDGFASGDAYFTVPLKLNGFNLTDADVAIYVTSSGAAPSFQIHNLTQTADMLSTNITVDATELNSYTAATPPVIDAANDDVATGDILRFDCDTAGTGVKGAEFHLVFTKP